MFKVGDKVHIKQWLDIPQEAREVYSMNIAHIGDVGTVSKFLGLDCGINSYNITLEDSKQNHFAFEPELESIIRVGEQLLLFEL